MGWFSRKQANPLEPIHATALGIGLDWNATRIRGVIGRPGKTKPHLLDPPQPELLSAISLEGRTAVLGRAGLSVIRRLPHTSCTGWLGLLGQPREWKANRHRLTPEDALVLSLERLSAATTHAQFVLTTLPAYLSMPQVASLRKLAEKQRLPLRGTISLPLAVVADGVLRGALVEPTAKAKADWIVPAGKAKPAKPSGEIAILVVDVDDHALTMSTVVVAAGQVRLLGNQQSPRLNLRAWKEQLLDGVADRCVRLCRRDPRDSALAEQLLYEQIDEAAERAYLQHPVHFQVRAEHWYQDIPLQPSEFADLSVHLTTQAVEAIREQCESPRLTEPPLAVWLTHAASRLPGLARVLPQNLAERTGVEILAVDLPATAAANLTDLIPPTHADVVLSLPTPSKRSIPSEQEVNG